MQVKIVQVPRSQTHTQMHTSAGNPLSPSHLSARIRQVSTHSSVKASARHVGKGLNTLCVQSAQSRTRSSDIALVRSLK